MHGILERQIKRHGLAEDTPPVDKEIWVAMLGDIDRTYVQTDQDRYLLERSLDISSREMQDINQKLTTERESLELRNQQYTRVYEFARSTLEQMRQTLLQSADRVELMAYVTEMQKELEGILKED